MRRGEVCRSGLRRDEVCERKGSTVSDELDGEIYGRSAAYLYVAREMIV